MGKGNQLMAAMSGRRFIEKYLADRKTATKEQKINAVKLALLNVFGIREALLEFTKSLKLDTSKSEMSRRAQAEIDQWDEVVDFLKEELRIESA